ncbi:MAG: hypothetical protein K2M82_04985 [Lachnospiraceae bacterium]|nr:hypothetical protein [Lachnospiraceae bacterium]
MNEREELIKNFSEAKPVIEELAKYENKLIKNEYMEKRVIKKILIPTMIILFIVGGSMYDVMGSNFMTFFCFILFPAVILFSFILYLKNKKTYIDKIQELEKNPLLAFLPPNYRDCGSATHICTILVNCRAYSLTDAINIYEQDLHNRIMEAKY